MFKNVDVQFAHLIYTIQSTSTINWEESCVNLKFVYRIVIQIWIENCTDLYIFVICSSYVFIGVCVHLSIYSQPTNQSQNEWRMKWITLVILTFSNRCRYSSNFTRIKNRCFFETVSLKKPAVSNSLRLVYNWSSESLDPIRSGEVENYRINIQTDNDGGHSLLKAKYPDLPINPTTEHINVTNLAFKCDAA